MQVKHVTRQLVGDVCLCALACCVVARQYSAVLRMLQIRQSSSTVNFAASEPSFSFSRLLMVRPPLLLLDLDREIDVTEG